LATYNQLAEQNANRLARFNIDALDTYHYARKLAEQMRNGATGCQINETVPPAVGPTATSSMRDSSLNDEPNYTQPINTSGHRDVIDVAVASGSIHG